MKRALIVMFTSFAAGLITTQSAALHLTPADCLRCAYRNRPSLKVLQYAVQEGKHVARSELSGYFPQIHVSQTLAHNTRVPSESLTVETRQLLYSFAGPLDLYKIAKQDLFAARMTQQLGRDLVRIEVERAFLDLWLTQEKRKRTKKLHLSARSILNRNQQEVRSGLRGKEDWLSAYATYAQDSFEASRYENDLHIATSNLKRALGTERVNRPHLLFNPSTHAHLRSRSYYIKIALHNRKELKIKDYEIKKERAQKHFHQKGYLPSINAIGNITRSKSTNQSASFTRAFGLSLDWTAFDGLSKLHHHRASHANVLKKMMEWRDIKTTIENEVAIAFSNAMTTRKQLRAAHATLVAEHNTFLRKQQELRIGTLAQTDLDDAYFNWQDAEFTWLSIVVSTIKAARNLFFVCGYPKATPPLGH